MACLFCQLKDGHLHECRTLELDVTIRQMTSVLQETELMARMEGGDLIALEAKYHMQCLRTLKNRYRSFLREHEHDFGTFSEDNKFEARTLVELFSHVENCVEMGLFTSNFRTCISYMRSDYSTLAMRRRLTEHDSKRKFQYIPTGTRTK